MAREISAGGVVMREISGVWHVALIEPQRENSQTAKGPRKPRRAVLSLSKGLVDTGEKPEATAVREVREETGISAEVVTKLADIKYVYVRTWQGGERVFKIGLEHVTRICDICTCATLQPCDYTTRL